ALAARGRAGRRGGAGDRGPRGGHLPGVPRGASQRPRSRDREGAAARGDRRRRRARTGLRGSRGRRRLPHRCRRALRRDGLGDLRAHPVLALLRGDAPLPPARAAAGLTAPPAAGCSAAAAPAPTQPTPDPQREHAQQRGALTDADIVAAVEGRGELLRLRRGGIALLAPGAALALTRPVHGGAVGAEREAVAEHPAAQRHHASSRGPSAPSGPSASSAVSGVARSSRFRPSALTPKTSSASPPSAITAAATRKPIATGTLSPVSMRVPNSSGPAMPPTAVPTA